MPAVACRVGRNEVERAGKILRQAAHQRLVALISGSLRLRNGPLMKPVHSVLRRDPITPRVKSLSFCCVLHTGVSSVAGSLLVWQIAPGKTPQLEAQPAQRQLWNESHTLAVQHSDAIRAGKRVDAMRVRVRRIDKRNRLFFEDI